MKKAKNKSKRLKKSKSKRGLLKRNNMENIKLVVVGLVVGIVVLMGATFFRTEPTPPLGSASGQDHYFLENFRAGILNSGLIATSSQGSSITVTANEFAGWANSSLVSYAPGLLTTTLTLPASSTLAMVVPKPGDSQEFCIQNATSTAGSYVTLAGGLGTKLLVASTSATVLGGTKITTGKIGCLTLIREAATSSAFDIDVLYKAYQ